LNYAYVDIGDGFWEEDVDDGGGGGEYHQTFRTAHNLIICNHHRILLDCNNMFHSHIRVGVGVDINIHASDDVDEDVEELDLDLAIEYCDHRGLLLHLRY
jgi:hypothetical protein